MQTPALIKLNFSFCLLPALKLSLLKNLVWHTQISAQTSNISIVWCKSKYTNETRLKTGKNSRPACQSMVHCKLEMTLWRAPVLQFLSYCPYYWEECEKEGFVSWAGTSWNPNSWLSGAGWWSRACAPCDAHFRSCTERSTAITTANTYRLLAREVCVKTLQRDRRERPLHGLFLPSVVPASLPTVYIVFQECMWKNKSRIVQLNPE